ncbi:MAG TPA: hypothetical protein DD379_01410 [Cyanobacteria bacterium UBA11162]|nr:hypothetical protein [Cyanobacteria bacterium UBA11162]
MKILSYTTIEQDSFTQQTPSQNYRKILAKIGNLVIRPLINFWRFSYYYGHFITHSTNKR